MVCMLSFRLAAARKWFLERVCVMELDESALPVLVCVVQVIVWLTVATRLFICDEMYYA